MNPFDYDFMRNALAAAVIVAVLAGAVGYCLVLRGQSFAGHALGHVGFAGAALALLVGAPPLAGLVAATVAGGAGMGALGDAADERDVGIGLVLALSLGLGVLFLSLLTHPAVQATSLLFGNVLGVDEATVRVLLGIAGVSLLTLGAMARPLLFASLQPELAEARGVPMRALGVAFLAVVGLAVAASAEIVGVLLVFTLLVAPAATAQRLTGRLWGGVGLSVLIGVGEGVGGLLLAFYSDWPVGFAVTALAAAGFLVALAWERRRGAAGR